MAVLDIRDVTVCYGKVKALAGLSLRVEQGQRVAIIGPNGSGKTTLLRSIVKSSVALSEGSIKVGCIDVGSLRAQDIPAAILLPLYPYKRVQWNIEYESRVWGEPKKSVRARARSLAKTLGVTDLLNKRPDELSTGERQRVTLAVVLMQVEKRRLLLLDEPFENLDAVAREDFMDELNVLIEKFGLTTLLVTHDRTEAIRFCGECGTVVVMKDGRVEQSGTIAELMRAPTSFVEVFFTDWVKDRADTFNQAAIGGHSDET